MLNKRTGLALLVATLVGCGGGSPAPEIATTAAAPNIKALASTTLTGISQISPVDPTGFVVDQLQKISEVRISRTVYELRFRPTVQITHSGYVGLVLTLSEAGPGTQIVSGVLPVGDASAATIVTPTVDLVVRHDRLYPFDQRKLKWTATAVVTPPSGILLTGNGSTLATSVLTDYIAPRRADEMMLVGDPADRNYLVYSRIVSVALRSTTTVDAFNALLIRLGAKLSSSRRGLSVLEITISPPNTKANLDNMVKALEDSGLFDVVSPVPLILPDVLPDNLNVDETKAIGKMPNIANMLAAKLPAFWNMYAMPEGNPLVIVDYFGRGAPLSTDVNLTEYGALWGASYNFAKCSLITNYFASLFSVTSITNVCEHGYHVLGIAAGSFGGDQTLAGKVTGSSGKLYAIKLIDLVDRPDGMTAVDFMRRELMDSGLVSNACGNRIGDQYRHLVISLSLGGSGEAAKHGRIWKRYLKDLAEPYGRLTECVLTVSSAGNRSTSDSRYSAYTAQYNSPWNFAALVDDALISGPKISGLVVGNRVAEVTANGVIRHGNLHPTSVPGGNISAVGTDVFSFTGPNVESRDEVGLKTGTSMATPLVAGLASSLSYFPANLVVTQLIATGTVHADAPATPSIDAYAFLNSPHSGRSSFIPPYHIRQSYFERSDIFPPRGLRFGGAEGVVAAWLSGTSETSQLGRLDLNGDGLSDPRAETPFDLTFGTLTDRDANDRTLLIAKYGNGVVPAKQVFSETAVSDFDVFCFDVYGRENTSQFYAERNGVRWDKVFSSVYSSSGKAYACGRHAAAHVRFLKRQCSKESPPGFPNSFFNIWISEGDATGEVGASIEVVVAPQFGPTNLSCGNWSGRGDFNYLGEAQRCTRLPGDPASTTFSVRSEAVRVRAPGQDFLYAYVNAPDMSGIPFSCPMTWSR